mmetsp:Transcript_36151/g.55520  ORF Transcript_36151/g.55520 Transcript_36151/m.55520 type:complete len:171 (+) Transcript_36151:97-609(+)
MQQPEVWKKARLMEEQKYDPETGGEVLARVSPKSGESQAGDQKLHDPASDESFMEPKSSPEQEEAQALSEDEHEEEPTPRRRSKPKSREQDEDHSEDAQGLNGESEAFDPLQDFVSFDDITKPNEPTPQSLLEEKLNRTKHYPWLSEYTLKYKDVNCFLHNEVIDFVQWI